MSRTTKITLKLEVGIYPENEEWNKPLDCSPLIDTMLELFKNMKISHDQVLEFARITKVETSWEE